MAKESKLAMLPWWPADYLSATRSFTLAERGAYTDMLFYSWLGDLPADPSRLARMLGVSVDELEAVLPALKGKFRARLDNPEFIANPRLEQERIKSQTMRAKAAEKASKAGKASWTSPKRPARSKAQSNAPSTYLAMLGAKHEQCPPALAPVLSSSQSESPSESLYVRKEPKPGNSPPYAHDGQDSIIELESEKYARDRARFVALKADYPPGAQREDWKHAFTYARAIVTSSRGSWEQLHEGVRRYRKHIQRTGSYVMNPVKFFSASDQPWAQTWGFGPKARESGAAVPDSHTHLNGSGHK